MRRDHTDLAPGEHAFGEGAGLAGIPGTRHPVIVASYLRRVRDTGPGRGTEADKEDENVRALREGGVEYRVVANGHVGAHLTRRACIVFRATTEVYGGGNRRAVDEVRCRSTCMRLVAQGIVTE